MADGGDRIAQQGEQREALQEVIRAIRRNVVRVVFTTLVFVLLGYGLTLLWPNKYESVTQFILRDWHIVDAAIIDELSDISYSKKLQTLQNELRSRKRIETVMNELQWVEWLDTAGKESERRTLIKKFGENLTVAMEAEVTGASNVSIKFQWTDPRKSATFVSRLRDGWIQLLLEGDKKDKEEALDRQEATVQNRDAEYATALAALRAYELENKVPSLLTSETNNTMKSSYKIQLTTATAELESVVGEIALLQAKLQSIPKEIEAPVKPGSPEQAAAMAKVAAAADNLKKMADPITGYTANHPKRLAAQRDYDAAIAGAKSFGEAATKTVEMQTNPVYYETALQLETRQAKERETRALVNELQRNIDETQHNLDLLPVVAQELERLRMNIDVAAELAKKAKSDVQPIREQVKRLRAASFGVDSAGAASQATGPIEIVEPAVEADDPVLPISAIIMAVALVVGLAVGILGPVITEMTRSSFGTVKEVSRSLGVPVLGAVDMILTARDLRAHRIQQTLTWATMVLVLLSLATALYIWRNHPENLPASLMRALRDVRMALT